MKLQRLLACVFFLVSCDRTELQPTDAPTLDSREGLVAIVMTTDKPVLTVHYVSEDNENQFNLVSAEPGTSMQVHRVPADRYCVRSVKWPVSTFHADYQDRGSILCMEVKPGILNYPGHLQFGEGENTLARSGFRARYVPAGDDFERRIRESYPELAPLL